MQFLLATFATLLLACSARQICYENGVGCFSDDAPFDNLPLPMDPVDLAPTFYILQKDKEIREIKKCDELDVTNLVVLTHGFGGTYNNTYGWNSKITTNVHVVRPTADILFIEWEKGAELGKGKYIYHQPASNVRVVAKLVAMWLKANTAFDSTKVHCIGFSLGAHICGFTAKAMGTKWGRLSAVDPAGPAFMKDDPVARVDKDDGIVVDVSHGSWVGLQRQIGHKDFYINDARVQPGCISKRRRRSLIDRKLQQEILSLTDPSIRKAITDNRIEFSDIFDIFGCSHYRTAHVFASSILEHKDCSFLYCPCPSMEHYKKGHCRNCSPSEGQLLGYRSFESQKTGLFYGAATGAEPFCIPK